MTTHNAHFATFGQQPITETQSDGHKTTEKSSPNPSIQRARAKATNGAHTNGRKQKRFKNQNVSATEFLPGGDKLTR